LPHLSVKKPNQRFLFGVKAAKIIVSAFFLLLPEIWPFEQIYVGKFHIFSKKQDF
jgi:hypothetical protein